MNKRNNILLRLSMFISIIMIFFGANIGNLYIIQFISCSLAIISSYKSKIIAKKDTMVWLIACLITLFTVIISEDKIATIEIVALINMVVIIKIIYENNFSGWQKLFIIMLSIASGVHVFATIIELIFPHFIMSVNAIILRGDSLIQNQMFLKRGIYAGITGQTSINAYYIAIFIGITFTKIILKNKHNQSNIILLLLGIVALFITGKRGMLLFTTLSIIIVYLYIMNKDKKNILKYIFYFCSISIIGYVVIINIPETQIVFKKMELLQEEDNILNGRDYLWRESIKLFLESPILGVGPGVVDSILGNASHNIYIQLLAETGILGFFTYTFAILFSLILSLKKAKDVFKNGETNLKQVAIISIFIQLLFITYGFTGNPLFSNIFLTPYIIAIAMINAISIKERSDEINENRNNYLP